MYVGLNVIFVRDALAPSLKVKYHFLKRQSSRKTTAVVKLKVSYLC